MKYEGLKGDVERQISIIVGFGKLRGRLIERGGDRPIMQKSQERRGDNINQNLPTIAECGNVEKESAIPMEDGPNLEDLDLVQDGRHATITDREEG